MSHWLIIEKQGEDYMIEHPADCPQEDWLLEPGPNGQRVMLYTCLLGTLIHEAGLEESGVDWRSLVEGRYEIEAWAERSPAGPWGPQEWDAGISLRIWESPDTKERKSVSTDAPDRT